MKKTTILFLAATVVGLTSCSNDSKTEDEAANESITYSLDTSESTINWTGRMSADYFHSGTVNFSEGSISMTGEELSSGSFIIDMNSINDTSMEEPNKSDALSGHLMGTMPDENHPVNMFFNTPKFPNATVTLGKYNDGQLEITLNVVGVKIKQTVPVKITADEDEASIKGVFNLDLASINAPGFATQEDGSGISSIIEFEVFAVLKKK